VILLDCLDSPIGPLSVAVRDGRVCVLHFGARSAEVRAAVTRWYPGEPVEDSNCAALRSTLTRYFDGNLDVLDEIEVEMNGTPFQRQVWKALRSIRVGTTTSYGELARRIGRHAAVRAVGTANGANPVALIVPCHRVIGSNGTLTGYGGGLDRKRWLLTHEGVRASTLF
jgi:methylated-DNA-[protein]-cysteine S-methyltransferase